MHPITPFLMFEDKAEEAMGFYVSHFPDSKIESVSRTVAPIRSARDTPGWTTAMESRGS
jgi:predicted 3-demethylubiquinone-9 3-methyltransferase (glyoxalase superfamily)